MVVWLYVSVHSHLCWVTNDSLQHAQVNGFGSRFFDNGRPPKPPVVSFWVFFFFSMKMVSVQHGTCSLAAWIKANHFLSYVGKREEVNRPFPYRMPWSLQPIDVDNVMNFANPTLRCLLTMRPCCYWIPNTQSWISWNYAWSPAPTVHTCEMYATRVAFRSELLNRLFLASRAPLFFSSGWPRRSCLARAVAGCRNWALFRGWLSWRINS